jgi:hypothetical protein
MDNAILPEGDEVLKPARTAIVRQYHAAQQEGEATPQI